MSTRKMQATRLRMQSQHYYQQVSYVDKAVVQHSTPSAAVCLAQTNTGYEQAHNHASWGPESVATCVETYEQPVHHAYGAPLGFLRENCPTYGTYSVPKYRGVRMRRGSFAAEIRDKKSGRRRWLGTYKTAEEASEPQDCIVHRNTHHRNVSPARCPGIVHVPLPLHQMFLSH